MEKEEITEIFAFPIDNTPTEVYDTSIGRLDGSVRPQSPRGQEEEGGGKV